MKQKYLGQNGDKFGSKNPRTRELFCVNLTYLFGWEEIPSQSTKSTSQKRKYIGN